MYFKFEKVLKWLPFHNHNYTRLSAIVTSSNKTETTHHTHTYQHTSERKQITHRSTHVNTEHITTLA